MFRPRELTEYDRQNAPQDANIRRAISVVTATLPTVSDNSAQFNLGFQSEQSNVNSDSDVPSSIEPASSIESVNSLDSNVSGEFEYLEPISIHCQRS